MITEQLPSIKKKKKKNKKKICYNLKTKRSVENKEKMSGGREEGKEKGRDEGEGEKRKLVGADKKLISQRGNLINIGSILSPPNMKKTKKKKKKNEFV